MNVFSYNTDLSRSLMESYLIKKDGKAVPFSSIDNYKTKTFMETFEAVSYTHLDVYKRQNIHTLWKTIRIY